MLKVCAIVLDANVSPMEGPAVAASLVCFVVFVDGASAKELDNPTPGVPKVCAIVLDANVSIWMVLLLMPHCGTNRMTERVL